MNYAKPFYNFENFKKKCLHLEHARIVWPLGRPIKHVELIDRKSVV